MPFARRSVPSLSHDPIVITLDANPTHRYIPFRFDPSEGRFAIVTIRGSEHGGRGGIGAHATTCRATTRKGLVSGESARRRRCWRGRRSRVVLTHQCWRQVSRRRSRLNRVRSAIPNSRSDGGTVWPPGRARRNPLKPLCRESRIVSAKPVVTTVVCILQSFAHGAAGAAGTRLSLRPLYSEATRFMHHPGASRRGNAVACRLAV